MFRFALLLLLPFLVSQTHSLNHTLLQGIRCLNEHEAMKPPNGKVRVNSELHLLMVHSLSKATMELKADFYLQQEWQDSRCKFDGEEQIIISDQNNLLLSNNLWTPDTFIINAKREHKQRKLIIIDKTGLISTQTRVSSTVVCPMNLHNYPLDRQTCSIHLQSHEYSSDRLEFAWNAPILKFILGIEHQDEMMPENVLSAYRFRQANKTLLGRKYSLLTLDFILDTPFGYSFTRMHMPATFVVIMAFIGFWIDHRAAPARVSLGVTTVLTSTTLLTNSNETLPVTGYPKGICLFLSGCFLFTFLALLEYAIVNYLYQQSRGRCLNRRDKLYTVEDDERGYEDINDNDADPKSKCRSVDSVARIIFPLLFILFHLVYWTLSLLNINPLPPEAVVLQR